MTKRAREQDQRKQRLLSQAADLDAENTLVAGRTYVIRNPHHLEHGRIAAVILTPGAALRRAIESPAAWTIWSGWCPGQAIVKVDGRTSWVSPSDLAQLTEAAKGKREMTAQKITGMEKTLMLAMTTNDYAEGGEEYWGGWTWACIDDSGIDPKQARGVLSSLIQKGLVTEETYARPKADYSLHFTDEGKVEVKKLLEAEAAEQAGEDASIQEARFLAEPRVT